MRRVAEEFGGSTGAVLPLVLILVLALELMAHGALLMARQEEAASHAGVALLQARVASESALATTAAPVGQPYLDTPIWGATQGPSGTVGAARYRVTLRRLSRETWWWLGAGRVETKPWTVRTGEPVWLPDPVERLRAFGAVVVVGAGASVVGAENVDASSVRRDEAPLDPTPCRPWLAELDTLFAGTATPAVRVERMDAGREPTLGALDRPLLLRWIGSEGNAGPRALPGDVRLEHEDASGLLVSGGDVTLVGGRYEGVVLSRGRVTLRGGARLVGFVRAAGGLDVAPGARVVGSGCRALVALSAHLDRWVRALPLVPGAFAPF